MKSIAKYSKIDNINYKYYLFLWRRKSMKNKVLKTIKKYNLIENGDKLVLGVSGGPDSIAMLNILNELRIEKDIELDFNIVDAHINHMIRDEAIEDENFVKKFCEEKGIEFYSKSIDIQKIANTDPCSPAKWTSLRLPPCGGKTHRTGCSARDHPDT